MAEKINVDGISDGMILAESVTNSMGQTILKAGTELKSKHKMLLKTWNVNEISIKSSEDEEDIIPEDNLRDLAKSKFMKRLNWEPSNNFENEIVEIGITNLYNELVKNKE